MKSCECCNNKKDFLFKYRYKGKTYYLCEGCDDEIGFLRLQVKTPGKDLKIFAEIVLQELVDNAT